MRHSIYLVFATIVFFVACNSNEPEHDAALEGGLTKSQAQTGSDSSAAMISDSSATHLDTNTAGTPVNMPVVATPGTTAPGMNPPHGEPGHRCDISVGAPLNSAPAKPAPPVVTQVTPTAGEKAATVAKTVTAPGMNPPHGEPGHRCDITVGAPLNSAPNKPATTTTTSTTVPGQPALAPVQISPAIQPATKDSGQ